MPGFSFVHCSDLHLGCQQFNDPVRWEDFGESFAHIVNFAIEKKVDFMLIGGDLFHHRSINARTLRVAMDLLGRLKDAGIRVFAIEGNHDKAFYLDEESWMEFLNRLGYISLLKPVFDQGRLQITPYNGSEGCMVEMEGLRIIGLGYLGATTRQRLEEAAEQLREMAEWSKTGTGQLEQASTRSEPAKQSGNKSGHLEYASEKDTIVMPEKTEGRSPFTIVLLHAAVDKLLGQDLAGVGREAFNKFEGKVDYFALGHIHGRQEYSGFIFNPGAPESVHIDEVRNNREKGFYYVRVEGRNKEVVFCPSRRRCVLYYDVDLTGTKLPDEALYRTFEKMGTEKLLKDSLPIVQVILHGNVEYSSFAIDTDSVAEQVKEKYGCLAVEVINNVNLFKTPDTAHPSFDREAVERLVISGLIQEEKPELSAMQEELTELILNLKNSLLAGAAGKDIIKAVEEMVEGMLSAEAMPEATSTAVPGGGFEAISEAASFAISEAISEQAIEAEPEVASEAASAASFATSSKAAPAFKEKSRVEAFSSFEEISHIRKAPANGEGTPHED